MMVAAVAVRPGRGSGENIARVRKGSQAGELRSTPRFVLPKLILSSLARPCRVPNLLTLSVPRAEVSPFWASFKRSITIRPPTLPYSWFEIRVGMIFVARYRCSIDLTTLHRTPSSPDSAIALVRSIPALTIDCSARALPLISARSKLGPVEPNVYLQLRRQLSSRDLPKGSYDAMEALSDTLLAFPSPCESSQSATESPHAAITSANAISAAWIEAAGIDAPTRLDSHPDVAVVLRT